MKNLSDSLPQSGYDLPLYGLHSPLFNCLHISGIICMTMSMVCAAASMVKSFKCHRGESFFSWSTCDRFIIYEALCDGPLILPRYADHIQVFVTKDYTRPEILCHFYGFVTTIVSSSQHYIVGIIAINIFAMMYFHKKLEFGKFDWILHLAIYGIPTAGGIVALSSGSIGPNGVLCLVDGVKGREIFSMFYTIPLLVILIMNAVLYLLSWLKISSEVRQIRANLGQDPPSRMTARRAATSMSMLVAAFLIQWWPTGLWGAWELFGKAHETLMHFCVTFANLGGVLNLGVYLIINRKRLSINKNNVGSVRGPKY